MSIFLDMSFLDTSKNDLSKKNSSLKEGHVFFCSAIDPLSLYDGIRIYAFYGKKTSKDWNLKHFSRKQIYEKTIFNSMPWLGRENGKQSYEKNYMWLAFIHSITNRDCLALADKSHDKSNLTRFVIYGEEEIILLRNTVHSVKSK